MAYCIMLNSKNCPQHKIDANFSHFFFVHSFIFIQNQSIYISLTDHFFFFSIFFVFWNWRKKSAMNRKWRPFKGLILYLDVRVGLKIIWFSKFPFLILWLRWTLSNDHFDVIQFASFFFLFLFFFFVFWEGKKNFNR